MATLLILKERIHLKAGRFDPLGALLIAVGMAGLTAGLSFGQEQGWTSPLILTLLLLGILTLVTLPFLKHVTSVTCPDPTLLWGGFYSHAPETVAARLSRYTSEAYRSIQAIDARLAQLIVAHTMRRPGSVRNSIA